MPKGKGKTDHEDVTGGSALNLIKFNLIELLVFAKGKLDIRNVAKGKDSPRRCYKWQWLNYDNLSPLPSVT